MRTRSLRTLAVGTESLHVFGIVTREPCPPVRLTGLEVVPLRARAAVVHRAPCERLEATSDEERTMRDGAIEQAGPVPPFDFVRLQVGG